MGKSGSSLSRDRSDRALAAAAAALLMAIVAACGAGAMAFTAPLFFVVRGLNQTALSIIRIISARTVLPLSLPVWSGRVHRVGRHRRAVRGIVTGALFTADVLTLILRHLHRRRLFG